MPQGESGCAVVVSAGAGGAEHHGMAGACNPPGACRPCTGPQVSIHPSDICSERKENYDVTRHIESL